MFSSKYIYPVCEFSELDEAPYDESGCALYGIRPCCGTEFGYDDSSISHSVMRRKWIVEGMQWWSKRKKRPENGDPILQLRNSHFIEFSTGN
mgnify:CR=1 FL=1